jgi:membrane protein DedA with SNARE-associated domain
MDVRRLGLAWLAVTGVLLALFVAFEPVLGEAGTAPRSVPVLTAALGVGLLGVDAVLPVASTAVMVVLGAAFGVAGGAALALLVAVGALVVGAGLGRAGRRPFETVLGRDRRRVEALVDRYGAFAVVVSRPVPLLAESVAIVAGAGGMPWPRLLAAGVAGTLPVAVVLAAVGARGGQGHGVAAATVLIVLALGSAAVAYVRERRAPAARPG